MEDQDIPCIGICQTDENGYCIGCGRRAPDFPGAEKPCPPEQREPEPGTAIGEEASRA